MQPNGSRIRVIVTEHNPALRDGIVALVEGQPDMEVINTSADTEHTFSEFRLREPHVVIVDVDVPNAIDLMRRLRHERPQTNVIALVNYEWDEMVQVAAEASGAPCLPKDYIAQRLLAVIRNRP